MTWTQYCTAIRDATAFRMHRLLMPQVKHFPKTSHRGERGSTAGKEYRESFATQSLNSQVSALARAESGPGWIDIKLIPPRTVLLHHGLGDTHYVETHP